MSKLVLVPIKPITANKAWQYSVSKGKIPRVIKRKSDEYKIFEQYVKNHLTGNEFFISEEGPLSFKSIYSTSRIDLDNCFKAFMDILEVVYKFNDNRIDEIHSRKIRVPKGQESIKFIITPYICENPEYFEIPSITDYTTLIFHIFNLIINKPDIYTPEEIYNELIVLPCTNSTTATLFTKHNIKSALKHLCNIKKLQEIDYVTDESAYMLIKNIIL